MVIVFFVSAVFHELVLGVPLHMVRLWAFSGIMLQVRGACRGGMGGSWAPRSGARSFRPC